jgi:hypothetical protein
VNAADVTACLVTRGDQPDALARIRETLIFDNVIVWDNSEGDMKTAGRYAAVLRASTPAVYFQDDDVIVPPATQQALLDAYEPGVMVANWAHGDTPGGYDDLPLVGAGAIVDQHIPWGVLYRYLRHHPADDGFLYEADFIAGALYPRFKHIHEPFEILMDVAQHPSRLCNQPWQADLKLEITNRARHIRDGMVQAA